MSDNRDFDLLNFDDEDSISSKKSLTDDFDIIDLSSHERPEALPKNPAPVRRAPASSGQGAPMRKPGARPHTADNARRAAATGVQRPVRKAARNVSRPQGAARRPADAGARPAATRTTGGSGAQRTVAQGAPRTVAPNADAFNAAKEKKASAVERRTAYPEEVGGSDVKRPEKSEHRSAKERNAAAKSRARAKEKEEAKGRKITVGMVIRRSLFVLFTALLIILIGLYSLGLMLAYGPSKTARDKAVMSALQASATKWVPGLFLPSSVIDQIVKDSEVVVTDTKTIDDVEAEEATAPDRFANAIDGIVFETVNGSSFKGYVLLIKNPARVIAGVSRDNADQFRTATAGMRIFEIAEKYNAVAAINGGEFRDDGGVGTGQAPMGLTYSQGQCVWDDGYTRTFIGIDKENKLIVRESMTRAEADQLGIRDGVSFQNGNTLITNDGTNVTYYYADSNTGVSQRTAIGQRADGTFIFIVTDGRTASSMGATRNDIINLLADYGAVSAGMLDGGSSSLLYYRDYFNKYNIDTSELDQYQLMGLVNKYKAFTEPRRIPTFFVVLPE